MVSVDWQASVLGSGWSTWTQWPSPTAVSTVAWLPPRVSVSVEEAVVSVDGTAAATCVGVGGGGGGVSRLAGKRALWSVEHLDSVTVTDGSVESGPAATTCVGVCGGGGGVSRWKASVLQSVDYLDTTAVASPTAMCRELNWLLPCVSVSVEVVVVSVDGRRACCSLRRTWTQ